MWSLLVPDLDRGRIKLGYAGTVSTRLPSTKNKLPHGGEPQGLAMQTRLQMTAIDALTRKGCRLIGGEVFHCDDLARP